MKPLVTMAIKRGNYMKSIVFITNRYPTEHQPTKHVFVQQLVWAIADRGIECTVISPVPFNKPGLGNTKAPLRCYELTLRGEKIRLFRPRYLSFGQLGLGGGLNTVHLSLSTFTRAVMKTITENSLKADVLYGHFLTLSGVCVSRVSRRLGIPGVVAYGESTSWSIESMGADRMRSELSGLLGMIAVSSRNKEVLLNNRLMSEEKIAVFPNGVNTERFFPRDKQKSREKFGWDQNQFIVAYVGQFTHRKGVERVDEALTGMTDIGVAFAGQGPLTPRRANIIHAGPVKPEDMPFFLSAADVFVLPTLNEGCSNAIIEAMACGLPIITSRLPFNYDILSSQDALLVDPNDVNEIRDAVIRLKEDSEYRKRLGHSALERARGLSLDGRAQKIIAWIGELLSLEC